MAVSGLFLLQATFQDGMSLALRSTSSSGMLQGSLQTLAPKTENPGVMLYPLLIWVLT